ncbi:MAG: TetR/AcrR family transcriptional regulator [Thalassovita sp.]
MTPDRAEQIMDIAERDMRKNGFDAVSFRKIAAEIGIKSASVHYHFATKGDLSAAVTQRYSDRFIEVLGSASAPQETAKDRIARLAAAYIASYQVNSSICLCAALGSVASHLPPETAQGVKGFYHRLIAWTETAMQGQDYSLTPALILSLLQGSMTLSIATQDDAPLIASQDTLLQMFDAKG